MPSQLLKNVFNVFIAIYRTFFRATFGNACCFQPSCSEYCVQAVETHGFFKGIALGSFRILRCHPFSKGGVDNVPHAKNSRTKTQGQKFSKAGNL